MNAPTPPPDKRDVSPTEATIPAETVRRPGRQPPHPAPAWTPETDSARGRSAAERSPGPVNSAGAADSERTEVIPPSAVPGRPAPAPRDTAPSYNRVPFSGTDSRNTVAPPVPPHHPPYPAHTAAGQWSGFGPAGYVPPAAASRKTLQRFAIGGAVAALVAVVFLVTALWAPGFLRGHTLDIAAADRDVAAILADRDTGYGLANVGGVTCNDGKNPAIKQGATFSCDVTVDGAHRKLTATFTDDAGTFTITRPE